MVHGEYCEPMSLTAYHAKLFAHELTKRSSSDDVDKLASALSDAQVDLNRNYQKMRTSEAYKARCGHKHFAALGVSFDVVDKVEQV